MTEQNSVDPAEELYGYCADCDKVWGFAARKDLGRGVRCQNNGSHHAAVVKGGIGKRWLQFEKYLIWWESRGSPFRWCNDKIFKKRAGVYIITRCLLLLIGLFIIKPGGQNFLSIVTIIISIFFLVDIILSNTSIAFATRFPARPLRSVVLTIFSFVQIVIVFSILYKYLSNDFDGNVYLTWVQSLYFSIVTITTLGYGDFTPSSDATLLQLVIFAQLVIGVYFLAIVLTVIAAWSTSSPTRLALMDVSELQPLEDDCG